MSRTYESAELICLLRVAECCRWNVCIDIHVMRLCGCRYAVQAMTSAYALYDFGLKHNKTAGTWNAEVKKTYGAGSSGQFMLYAAAMITWAHRCENTTLPLCSDNKARRWLAISEQEWGYQVVRIFPLDVVGRWLFHALTVSRHTILHLLSLCVRHLLACYITAWSSPLICLK